MEEYKKLYEQTQSKMKEFIKRWDGIKLSSNDLFTEELKQIVEIESEDERIRKEIIEMVRNWASVHYITKEQFSERMTWLEKQGEPNPYSGVSFKYNGHTWGMCARDNGVEILVDGEIKGRIFLDNEPQGKSALEAIKEEKVDNANKVEPKFKVGDWIMFYGGNPFKILKIEVDINGVLEYLLLDQNGNDFYFNGTNVDKNVRLWTIQDAKDGDVLVHSSFMFGDFIFIYNNTSILQAYCYYSNERNRFIIEDRGHHCPWNMQEVTPATKEQRDLLFQKMKEAGYEWDADKKELFHNQNQNG